MTTARIPHEQREQAVLDDLEQHFPDFIGQHVSWTKVPDGQDPPDFTASAGNTLIGLELVEWLDGKQMSPGKGMERQRDSVRQILSKNWQMQYQPQNFNLAVVIPRLELRIARPDEARLQQEFFACAEEVDKAWNVNPERVGRGYYRNDFPGYPTFSKYFCAIRFIEGDPHGACWIDVEESGGAYDPQAVVRTLAQAVDNKLRDYALPDKQSHFACHNLGELNLLIHGGFNAYCYNTPAGPLTLTQIAQRGATFYASHPHRAIFNRVWFFDSLDSADEINQLLGFPSGAGRVRWLAQLWPTFHVYPESIGR